MKFNLLLRANSGWPIFWGVFFYQPMSGFDNQLIDLIENLRCEKTQVILDRLPVVCRFVLPPTMSEHLPDGVVMVSQLMDAVVIAVETQAAVRQAPESSTAPSRDAQDGGPLCDACLRCSGPDRFARG